MTLPPLPPESSLPPLPPGKLRRDAGKNEPNRAGHGSSVAGPLPLTVSPGGRPDGPNRPVQKRDSRRRAPG